MKLENNMMNLLATKSLHENIENVGDFLSK